MVEKIKSLYVWKRRQAVGSDLSLVYQHSMVFETNRKKQLNFMFKHVNFISTEDPLHKIYWHDDDSHIR